MGNTGYKHYNTRIEVFANDIGGPITPYIYTGKIEPNTAGPNYIADVYDVVSCPLSTAPSPPTNLVASTISSSGFRLDWTAPTNTGGETISGYRIYKNGSHLYTSTETYRMISGLAEGSTATWSVKAINIIGESNLSVGLSVTIGLNVFFRTIYPSQSTSSCQPQVGSGVSVYCTSDGFVANGARFFTSTPGIVGSNDFNGLGDWWYTDDYEEEQAKITTSGLVTDSNFCL